MGAAYGLHRGFRKAKMPDLAFGDQRFHGSSDILDRHIRVDAVLVEEVDGLHPQTTERCFGHNLYMLGAAVRSGAALACDRINLEAEFGGDCNLAADRLDRF